MIHDVIPEKYPQLTLPTRTARLFWNTKVTLGCWQADAIVTISDYSRRGILDHLKIPSEQVFVIGEATDSIFRVIDDPRPTPRLEALGIATNDRTVVYVGGFGPHKNLEILIRALANLTTGEEFSDLRLVMVGEYQNEVFHSHFSAIKSRVEELGVGQRVSFTGYLPDEELVILLNTSTVLVLPSLMEGFGLPAIEAMACGCPVIATTESPLSAILGEAALYIDPRKPEDLERALMRLLRSVELRRKMRAAGIAAAQRLTWEKAAQEMIDVFSHVVNR
jgi:glycosyltransferase involved in cell wall biosynthesis